VLAYVALGRFPGGKEFRKYRRSASRTSSERVRCSRFIASSSNTIISGGNETEKVAVERVMYRFSRQAPGMVGGQICRQGTAPPHAPNADVMDEFNLRLITHFISIIF